MHHVELDQSGRTENQNEHSAVAFANGISASILISAREKRVLYQHLREQRERPLKRSTLHLKVFVTAVFVLIKDFVNPRFVLTIDREFDGRDNDLKSMLLRLIRTVDATYPSDNIVILSIGRRSPAHALAYGVYKKRTPPDRVVKAEDLLPYI